MDWKFRALAQVMVCGLLGGCTMIGGGAQDGEAVEARVAQLQRTVESLPLVMDWPVTPLPEGIKSLTVDKGWYYSQGKSGTVYGSTLEDGMLQLAYSGCTGDLDMAPVHNSTASIFVADNRCHAISHLTGMRIWSADLHAATTSSAAVSESHLYVGTYKRNLQSYNLADGHADWHWNVRDSYVTSRPAYHEPRVFFASENGTLFSLDAASGEGDSGHGILTSAKDAVTADLWVSGDSLYLPSADRNLYCVDRLSGKLRWQFTAATSLSSQAMTDDGICYLRSDDGILHALDEGTGEELWSIPGMLRFVVAIDGDAYILGTDRTLLRVDTSSGETMGKIGLGAWAFVPSNPEGDALVLGSSDGYVMALTRLDLYR